jgi:leucine-rich repeat-containing protein 16
LTTEGIFRLSGNATTISDYKEQINRGEFIDFSVPMDPNLLTGIMKQWFRELSNPLLTFERYPEFLKFGTHGDLVDFKALAAALAQLPTANRVLLLWLMKFLKKVSEKGSVNKMEASNLAIVFGPTILRQPATKAASKDELTATSSQNKLCEVLIKNYDKLFDSKDEALFEAPSRPARPMMYTDMPEFTSEERALVEPVLSTHKEEVTPPLHAFRVFKRVKASKSIEESEGVMIVGQNRVYLFAKGGKLDTEFHYLDILEVNSTNSAELKISFGLPNKPQELWIRSISYYSWDADIILRLILTQYELNFIGTPSDAKFKINIQPKTREFEIRSTTTAIDNQKGCGGFVRTYAAYCDKDSVSVTEEIAWDLDNLFYNNDVKVFNLNEFLKKDRPSDLQPLMKSLQHNTWFTDLIFDSQKLGSDVSLVASVMKTNKTVRSLSLAGVGATNTSIAELAEAFKSNTNLGLDMFSISDNILEDKSLIALAGALERFTSLGHLNISNCQVKTKGMLALIEALQKSPAICSSLHTLNISGNSLDSEGSRKLGLFLGKATALSTLNISATQPSFQHLCTVFEKSTSIQVVDISDLKVPKQTEDFVVHFLKLLPQLQDLRMRNVTGFPVQNLMDVLTQHPILKKLDISDNDWSDDVLIALGEHLAPFNQPERSPMLEELTMNRMFARRTKSRTQAIQSLISILELRPIKVLRVQGGGSSKLKLDLTPLVFGLINNRVLAELDISGNQTGDGLAVALGKVLQHNKAIHTLYWDDNSTTINGLRLFKLGLVRNDSLRKMPLPLLDLSEMLKSEADRTALLTLANEIQVKVFENAARYVESPVAGVESESQSKDESLDSSNGSEKRKSAKVMKRKSEKKMHERVNSNMSASSSSEKLASSANESPAPLRKATSTRGLKPSTSGNSLPSSAPGLPARPPGPAPAAPANPPPALPAAPPAATPVPELQLPEQSPRADGVSPRPASASNSARRRDIDKATLSRASVIFGGTPSLDEDSTTSPISPRKATTSSVPTTPK